MFGEEKVQSILLEFGSKGLEYVESKMMNALDAFTGDAEQNDDITLLFVEKTS